MARKKVEPTETIHIQNLEEANNVLAQIAECQRQIDRNDTEMNGVIDNIKASAKKVNAPMVEQIRVMENGLAIFAEYQKPVLFKSKKSVELTFGVIGFRKSSKLMLKSKTTWGDVLAKLKTFKFTDDIRTKEDVDKEKVKKWPKERMDLVGVRLVEANLFFYETKVESSTDEVSVSEG